MEIEEKCVQNVSSFISVESKEKIIKINIDYCHHFRIIRVIVIVNRKKSSLKIIKIYCSSPSALRLINSGGKE